MKYKLKINDNLITSSFIDNNKEESIINTVDPERYINNLFPELNRNRNLGLLPPAIRYVSGDKQTIVYERPPQFYLIDYVNLKKNQALKYKTSAHKIKEYETIESVPVPWTVYIIRFSEGYIPYKIFVYTRRNQIRSLLDPLNTLPLPNFYHNGELCNPFVEEEEAPNATLTEGILSAYNRVWNSGFNADLFDVVSNYFSKFIYVNNKRFKAQTGFTQFLKDWSKLSLVDVLNVNKTNFKKPRQYKNTNTIQIPVGTTVFTLRDALRSIETHVNPKEEYGVKVINAVS